MAALTEAEERGGGEGKQRKTRYAFSRVFYHSDFAVWDHSYVLLFCAQAGQGLAYFTVKS